jgi:hypothetical protein
MKTMVKCILKHMGIFFAMFIGMLIGSALLLVGSLFLSLWINSLLFGSEYHYGIVLLVWFGIVMLVISFLFGISECRRKLYGIGKGRKNLHRIEDL